MRIYSCVLGAYPEITGYVDSRWQMGHATSSLNYPKVLQKRALGPLV